MTQSLGRHRAAVVMAFVVCGMMFGSWASRIPAIKDQAGLDSATYSVPYLAGWSGGDIDLLRESMARVITVARAATDDDRGGNWPPASEALPPGQRPGPAPVLTAAAPAAAR